MQCFNCFSHLICLQLVKDVNNDQSEPSVVDKSLSNLLDKNAQLQADLVEKNQVRT